MSLKRILGTMLATRMAGRGRRRGGLGTAAMLGGLGRRRRTGMMGGKLGMAALGYMAYKAYQDQQSKAGTSPGGTKSGSSSGGLSGMVQDVMNTVTGGPQSNASNASAGAAPAEEDMREEAQAAESLSNDTALLLIRAMITAAYSDGSLSMDERQRIMGEIDQAGDAEDRAVMEREIANPKPLDELLTQVNDEETAEEFYMASRAAVDGESEADRAYLADLQSRLNLSDAQVAEVEEMAS